jgi:hypothetical protein
MTADNGPAAKPPPPGPLLNPYVFIVGSARSGTTLLERIVNAHPQIAITPSTRWVPRFYENRRGMTPDGLVTPKLVDAITNSRGFEEFGIRRQDLELLADQEQPINYSAFMSGFYELYGRMHGKRLVGDRRGGYGRYIPTLHELWPNARFVHLIRDGRDVCLSVLDWKENARVRRIATWEEDPVSTIALWWMRNVQLIREAGARLDARLYSEIQYEALVTRPEEECRSLCDFLEVTFDDAMLRFHEGRTRTRPDLTHKDAWLPITPGLRDWRSQMAREDVERFEAAAGDLLDALGYERGSAPSPERLEFAADLRRRFGEEMRRGAQALPSRW